METPGATSAQELYGAGVTVDMTSTSGSRAPVGLLSVGCSATAVAPDTVLTAAHCMCNWVTGQWIPNTGMGLFLPQAGGVTRAVASYTVHPEANCWANVSPFGDGTFLGIPLIGPPDLAVLTLATPIPLNVLQDYPRLHLGPTKADWDSGALADHTIGFAPGAFAVGWGGTVHYDSPVGAGTARRHGAVMPSLERDPCDKPKSPVDLEGRARSGDRGPEGNRCARVPNAHAEPIRGPHAMRFTVSAPRPLGLGLAALVLLRCGACDSESGGPRGQPGADASLDAASGGAKADARSGGGATSDAPALSFGGP
jgi:hypothetical protein